jgi:transcriptional repressor NrdR
MRCPYCNSTESQVKDSRPDLEDAIIRRRRVCNECGAKFTTIERVQMRDLMVRKSNGELESFDREKLKRSIQIACRRLDVPDERIEKFVNSIHRRLETETAEDILESKIIGNMVLESMLNLSPIAYVRFASIYHKFTKVSDFKKIINQIPEAADDSESCELPKKYKASLF